MIKKAIWTIIDNTLGVTDQLATYDYTDGTWSPCIFTSRKIPEDAHYPAIHITQVSGVQWGTRDSRGGNVLIDVDIYDDKEESDKDLNALAHDVWELLNRADLTVEGYTSILCLADPPMQKEDRDGYPGYLVRCRVLVLE